MVEWHKHGYDFFILATCDIFQAFVRFEDKPNSAEDILKRTLESKGGKLALGETEIQAEVVTGDAEDQYWERTLKAKNEAIERKGMLVLVPLMLYES